MLAIIRILIILLLSIFICIFGLIFCMFSPRNPCHVSTFGRLFGRMAPILGILIEVRRYPATTIVPSNYIYISNHQNNYDMITAAYVVQPGTVTVGKKSILWIPLFGLLYWITGNLLIDRNHKSRAHNTIISIANRIKDQNISIWMFPEGTRSRGRGLLPFKNGAFYTAITAGVPIIPICISDTNNKIKLNRWSNGLVIIEIMPPVDTSKYSIGQVKCLTKHCQELMQKKLEDLNAEVIKREDVYDLNLRP